MNKNILVIYSSKYGSSEIYAKLIGEKLNCLVIDILDCKKINLQNYSTIIYGAGVYAGSLRNIKLFRKLISGFNIKNIIICATGITNTKDASGISEIDNNIEQELYGLRYKCFHFMGRIKYNKLGISHKLMMKVLFKAINSKEEKNLTEHEKLILKTYGDVLDLIDRDSIEDLINYIKGV